MSGFTYKGYSTDTILNTKLKLATFSTLNEAHGHDRDNIIGNTTMTRPVPNEYGTQYQNPTFDYCLVKCNNAPFTESEQIQIERWLTSPKFSSPLNLIDDYGETIVTYDGKFIHTEWVATDGGYAGVTFTFQSTSPYPYRRVEDVYQIRDSSTIEINCNSDELEEYVYPVLDFYAPSSTNTVTLTNESDNSNTLTIRALDRLHIMMDCDNCILRDSTGGVIDFDDVGWEDVGNIYWLRLLPTSNTITITGNVNLTITYKVVVKRAGDWL